MRGVLRSLGQVQLDTISVLARSHELIPYARLGAVGRTTVEDAYWTGTHAFEYWSHAACVLPVEWPLFAFRRRAYRGRPHWGHELSPGAYDKVIAQLRDEGRARRPSWAARRTRASGGTGPTPRSPWSGR